MSYVKKAQELEALNKSRQHGVYVPPSGSTARLPVAWWWYKCHLRPWVQRLGALTTAAVSAVLVWSEATIGTGTNPDLSPFSLVGARCGWRLLVQQQDSLLRAGQLFVCLALHLACQAHLGLYLQASQPHTSHLTGAGLLRCLCFPGCSSSTAGLPRGSLSTRRWWPCRWPTSAPAPTSRSSSWATLGSTTWWVSGGGLSGEGGHWMRGPADACLCSWAPC